MSNCPCCGRLLLRHIHHGNLHWFCPNCRQEMPNFDKQKSFTSIRKVNLGKKPITAELPPYKCTKNTLSGICAVI